MVSGEGRTYTELCHVPIVVQCMYEQFCGDCEGIELGSGGIGSKLAQLEIESLLIRTILHCGRLGGKVGQLVVDIGRVCDKRKLRVNFGIRKVTGCSTCGDAKGISVHLNGELLDEVLCFKYMGSHVATKETRNVE